MDSLVCANCSDVSPTMNSSTTDGLPLFIYGISDIGCRTATMVCAPPMTNLYGTASVIADGRSFASGIGIAAVQLTCNANATWQINYAPQSYVYDNISCIIAPTSDQSGNVHIVQLKLCCSMRNVRRHQTDDDKQRNVDDCL